MSTRFDAQQTGARTLDLPRPTSRGTSTIFTGRVARVGAHQYSWGTEHRDASELKRIVTQLAGKPVTLQHPAGLIKDGAAARIVGQIDRAWVDGDYAVAEFRVDDQSALDEIRRGLRQLSLGYDTHADARGFQTGTVVDHLALVERARCGDACSLRADDSCGCGGSCKQDSGRYGGHLQDSGQDGKLAEQRRAIACAALITAYRR